MVEALPQGMSPEEQKLAMRANALMDNVGAFMEEATQRGRPDLVEQFQGNLASMQEQLAVEAEQQMDGAQENMQKAGKTAMIIGVVTSALSAIGSALLIKNKFQKSAHPKFAKSATIGGFAALGFVGGSAVAGRVLGKKAQDSIGESVNSVQLATAQKFVNGTEALLQNYVTQLGESPVPAELNFPQQTAEAVQANAMDDARVAAMQANPPAPVMMGSASIIDEAAPRFSANMAPREQGNFAQNLQAERLATAERPAQLG